VKVGGEVGVEVEGVTSWKEGEGLATCVRGEIVVMVELGIGNRSSGIVIVCEMVVWLAGVTVVVAGRLAAMSAGRFLCVGVWTGHRLVSSSESDSKLSRNSSPRVEIEL
jgi:hypothetical protein